MILFFLLFFASTCFSMRYDQKFCGETVYVLDSQLRSSSSPYITGDGFRAFCDFVIDETNLPFDPSEVKNGNTIFLHTAGLEMFVKDINHRINAKYILVTHNCDFEVPGDFRQLLDEPNLIAWFSVNVQLKHPKLISLPIGIPNSYWMHGRPVLFNTSLSYVSKFSKQYLLYMNFTTGNNYKERQLIDNFFSIKSYCYKTEFKDSLSYHRELALSKFVLSPPGRGFDCYRTWEALLMGAYPIVKTSAADCMYDDLPVVIVKYWTEITQEFLENKYKEMKNKKYNTGKLYLKYWLDQIKEKSNEVN